MHRILVVDDDTFLLDMYALKFKEHDYEVETAQSGEAAIERLRGGGAFDVILLDMIMPKMTGIDLLKTIKTEKLGGTPICMVLSNQGEKADIEAATAAGAAGYIIKANVIPSEVVAMVEKVFEKHK